MRQNEIVSLLGEPDAVSTMVERGRLRILKKEDVEFHFDARYGHTLCLVCSGEAGIDILYHAE